MGRIPRYLQWVDDAAYHVFNRGHNREAIFMDDDDRMKFLDLIDEYRQRFRFRLYHYCLMINHFHLLLQLEDPRILSSLVAGFQRAYVHHFHRRHQFVGHLWQGRFKSPVVQRQGYWLSCGRYIERNPLEAGIAERPWEYRWSSAAAYALGRTDRLLTEDPEYLSMGSSVTERRQNWRRFLMANDPREQVVLNSEELIGDDQFRRRMRTIKSRMDVRRRGRPRQVT